MEFCRISLYNNPFVLIAVPGGGMSRSRERLRRVGGVGLIALLNLLAWLAANPAWAEARVALVVGNAAYQYAPALANPINDARGVAAALQTPRLRGREEALDLDPPAMLRTLQAFLARCSRTPRSACSSTPATRSQVRGQSYLVPVDARLEREADLIFQAVELDDEQLRLTRQQAQRPASCSSMPAATTRSPARSRAAWGTRSQAVGQGLAEVASGAGTLIAFATQPGNVAVDGRGANSPFTAGPRSRPGPRDRPLASAGHRRSERSDPGPPVPWWHASLTGDFYFRLPEPEPEAAAHGA